MRRIATVDVPVHNGVPGNKPYSQVVVNRRNSFTWSHRYPVYELVSPRGRVYVMQSYAQTVDKHLTLSALPHISAADSTSRPAGTFAAARFPTI